MSSVQGQVFLEFEQPVQNRIAAYFGWVGLRAFENQRGGKKK